MGCDIHTHAERRVDGKWQAVPEVTPFDWRSYGMYGFLAGVRNYSAVPQIAQRRDVPADLSGPVREDYERWDCDAHSASWLSLDELLAFNYDQPVEDRRVTINGNGGCTAERGGGEMTTYREFLGKQFFDDLEKMKAVGAERVVFWFDQETPIQC